MLRNHTAKKVCACGNGGTRPVGEILSGRVQTKFERKIGQVTTAASARLQSERDRRERKKQRVKRKRKKAGVGKKKNKAEAHTLTYMYR